MFRTLSKKFLNRICRGKKQKIWNNEYINYRKAEAGQAAFVITFVIHPWNLEFNRQRYDETIKTIESIRKFCPGVPIIFIEGGQWHKKLRYIEGSVEKFLYFGDQKGIRWLVQRKNKGVGEAGLMCAAFPVFVQYPFLCKISARYRLSDDFQFKAWDLHALNFKNYFLYKNEETYGLSGYKEGSHSTRLYGVPSHYFAVWKKSLQLSCLFMLLGRGRLQISLEYILPMLMEDCLFYYHKTIGVKGNVAGRKPLQE